MNVVRTRGKRVALREKLPPQSRSGLFSSVLVFKWTFRWTTRAAGISRNASRPGEVCIVVRCCPARRGKKTDSEITKPHDRISTFGRVKYFARPSRDGTPFRTFTFPTVEWLSAHLRPAPLFSVLGRSLRHATVWSGRVQGPPRAEHVDVVTFTVAWRFARSPAPPPNAVFYWLSVAYNGLIPTTISPRVWTGRQQRPGVVVLRRHYCQEYTGALSEKQQEIGSIPRTHETRSDNGEFEKIRTNGN